MITYRTFKNLDPPRIRDLWNDQSMLSRGFGRLRGCDELEFLLFSRPYFDREGFFLVFDDDRLIGLAHGGFGCNADESALDRTNGTVAMLLVDPDYRRRGIGTELLGRVLQYLRDKGAVHIHAGSLHPINPFYLGMYGGSELPGILESDEEATRFFRAKGFEWVDSAVVYQLPLQKLGRLDDHRMPLLRRQVAIQAEQFPSPKTWWECATFGSIITYAYEMIDRETPGHDPVVIGRALVWVMETFSVACNMPVYGVTQFHIEESRRRQGFGKLFMFSILRHLQENQVGLVEVQTMAQNEAARGLYEGLGFEVKDNGHLYRLPG